MKPTVEELTQAKVRELFGYDPETGVLTWRVRQSNSVKVGDVVGTLNSDGYLNMKIFERYYKTHRVIWFHVHGQWPKQCLDHIDGNRTNNSIANLRECTVAENGQNRSKSKNNTSGYTGVCFKEGRWLAKIRHNKKCHYLGYFDSPQEASQAYQEAKNRLHTFHPTTNARLTTCKRNRTTKQVAAPDSQERLTP